LYSGARRNPKPSGRHSRTPSEKIRPFFSVWARRIWKINSCLRMPLEPGMARSLAIFARSVIFLSFSSARLMLIVFISLLLDRDKPAAQAGVALIGRLRTGAIRFPTGLAKLEIQFMGNTNYSCVLYPEAPHKLIPLLFIGTEEP